MTTDKELIEYLEERRNRNNRRNGWIAFVLGMALVFGFGAYKAYESKQDTERFRQEQVERFTQALLDD